MRRGLWLLVLALGILGACSAKNSNTTILVAVWTNLSVPSEMDSIRIDAKGPSASPSFRFPLTAGRGRDAVTSPVVVELVSPDDKGVAFDVTASGYQGTSVVIAQSAHLSFDPGHRRVLALYLDRACMGATSGPCTQPIIVDVTSLPEYDPRTPFLAPDASPQALDAPGSGRAETGEVGIPADAAVGVDTRQVGDATADETVPDAGPEVSADDTSCANGCTKLGDASTDNQALDTARDAAPETIAIVMDGAADRPLNSDALADAPADLPVELPPDLALDVTLPDDAAACVLPMTICAGACINPQTNPSHCGGCGQACGTQNGTPSCTNDVCSMATCLPGFLNCSGNENTSRDGCETNANTDSANCGHCGNSCSSRVCRNQTCLATARYGNTGSGTGWSPFEGNFLAGIQVYIPNDSVVTGFGAVLYSGTANATMYLGLYKDMAGSPGAMVATVSAPTLVTPGGKEMNVDPPVSVTAGTYWILGVWDGLATFASNSTATVTWRYVSYPFASLLASLPATAPTSMETTSLPPPNLFVIVAQ